MSRKAEAPVWDKDFEPLIKVVLGKKGLKTKNAKEIGQRQRDYFRGRDFKKLVTSSGDLLKRKCSGALKVLEGKVPETDEDVEKLGQELIARGFCYRAVYKPLNPKAEDPNKPKKWPDRLQRMQPQKFEVDGYYIIAYEGDKGMRHFLLGLIIAGILLACMFPVWPIWAKIGMWYLSVVFLTLYFGVLILRMIVYTLFWIVGFDFWILPNINDEYLGFLDSFRPAYSFEKRKDDLMMLVVRFGCLAIVAVAAEQIAQTTSLQDVADIVTAGYADVIDWGVDKLTALPGSANGPILSIEDLKKQFEGDDDDDENATATVEEAAAGAEEVVTEEAVNEEAAGEEGETVEA